jgi:hypothetical protein
MRHTVCGNTRDELHYSTVPTRPMEQFAQHSFASRRRTQEHNKFARSTRDSMSTEFGIKKPLEAYKGCLSFS